MKTVFVLLLLAVSFAGGIYTGQSVSYDFRGMVDGWVSGAGESEAPATDGDTVDEPNSGHTSVDASTEADASETPSSAPATPTTNPDLDQIRIWISEARTEHPYSDSEEKMFAVMMCESGGQADIINPAGPYSGLFQYATPTWNGEWNAYRGSDILDGRAQIFATALAWNLGMQSQWGCYNRAH